MRSSEQYREYSTGSSTCIGRLKSMSLFMFSFGENFPVNSNSHETSFNVNFALNIESCLASFFGKSLGKFSTISSILFILLENSLMQSVVSLQSGQSFGAFLLTL